MTAPQQVLASSTLTWRIGTAAGSVDADTPSFVAYAQRHIAPVLTAPDAPEGAPPRVSARLRWHERPPRPRRQFVHGIDEMDRPDRDLYTAPNRIAWFRIDDFRQLVLQARCDDATLHIDGDYHFYLNRSAWSDSLRRIWEARSLDRRREKRFATLLYYLVYYPAMWWHESFADTYPLHAAGVAAERGALLLAGPSGVGKSTLCVALAAAGGCPLSETFVLHRGREITAVPEPVLLDAWSQTWLGDGIEPLRGVPGHFVFDRSGFHFQDNVKQAAATAIILPRRAASAGVAELRPEVAHRRISRGHQLIKDMRRYWAFAAAMENLRPDDGATSSMLRREQALAALTRDVPCWELRLTPDLPCAEATAMLAEIAARSGGGGLAARSAA